MVILVMLMIGFILITYALVAILKESDDFQNILRNKEENSEPWQVELGRIRSEFAVTLSEMQSEILEMSDKIEGLQERNNQLYLKNIRSEESVIKKYIEEKYQVLKVGKNKVDRKELKKMYKEEENIPEPIKKVEKTTISEEKKETKAILIEEVRALIKEGCSLDEVSEKLNIGKGEVLLIKQLYIN